MKPRILSVAVALALLAPATASADFTHTVSPGESLSSIAATDGLTVTQLAADNGLSPDTQLASGQAIVIPPQQAAATAPAAASGESAGTTEPAALTAPVAATGGSYVVEPGDTLSAIAARSGVSVSELAAANRISDPDTVIAGTALSLGGAGSSASAEPVSDSTAGSSSATGGPYPTDQTVSPSTVGEVAAGEGSPPALTTGVADQESGFNNDEVSSAGAVGVMQIEPGTWDYINKVLTPGAPLDPYSATDNVRAGSMYLRSLIAQTGSDSLGAAAYYQGIGSVERYGVLPGTEKYIASVESLAGQYGG